MLINANRNTLTEDPLHLLTFLDLIHMFSLECINSRV